MGPSTFAHVTAARPPYPGMSRSPLLLLLGLLLGCSHATVLLLGPTTDLQSPDEAGGVDSAEIVRQLLMLVEGDGVASWNQTFTHVNGSGGALHARQQVFGFMSALQQSNYARAANALNLRLSIETGGAFCGAGSGATAGQNALRKLAPFLEAGGQFSYVALESCFSRTHAGCKAQSQQATAEEVAAFAKTLAEGLQQQGLQQPLPKFFLYDALPHMTVDKSSSSPGGGKWPRNVPSYDLDLGTLLRLLRTAMANQKLALEGYWLDCPYEYSRDYPNATQPLPAGSGFEKVADAVALVKSMGLAVGKTFNSQQGGARSDELFYTSTLQDYLRSVNATGGVDAFDYAMVESWYPHPANAAPEEQEYTTTYTANAVFNHVKGRGAPDLGMAAASSTAHAVAAAPGGLTLTRFNNTALVGKGAASEITRHLERLATCTAPTPCSQPSSLLLTGRLAPPAAGRYGFELTFDPPLPYPSAEAYCRLWVDDHLLYPNVTGAAYVKGRKYFVGPRWLPFPPRALDARGGIVEAAGSAALGAYEIRLEYVCLSLSGCPARAATLRWAAFTGPYDRSARFMPISSSALLPAQGAPEIARRKLAAAQEAGWGTWDHQSELSWVLLPESFVVHLSLYRISTGEYLPTAGLTVHKPTPGGGHSTARPQPVFVMKAGLHSLDQSYIQASVAWSGGDSACGNTTGTNASFVSNVVPVFCAERETLNVSIATTVDKADNSQLTMTATVLNGAQLANASDFAIILAPNFTNGRAGSVAAGRRSVGGVSAGLRTTTLSLISASSSALSLTSPLLPATHLAVQLDAKAPVVLSTNTGLSVTAVLTKTAAYRATERATLTKYGEWADVKDAVQTSLMWSLVYDPKQSLVAPSYGFTGGGDDFEPSTTTVDGDTADNMFEWDQSFCGYMLGLDALGLALSQLIAVTKFKTAAGFIPGLGSGNTKDRTGTQPPVTAKALWEVAKRWGPGRTKWAVELLFNDLYTQNSWMFTQRTLQPLNLVTYGTSPYDSWAPDGTTYARNPGCGNGESGLDNGPTVEGVGCTNQSGQMLQSQYSAGQTGLYMMDTTAQIGLAKMIGREDAAAELQRRLEQVGKACVSALWNASEGVFQNKKPTPLTPIEILAPTHFYPLLGGPTYGPSEEIAVATVTKALTNPAKMAVWPSANMPADVPPVYARPLVQWYSQKIDDKGHGNTTGPHVLCCQPECNYDYAVGDFVQRCHGKLRYEGMAMATRASNAELGLPDASGTTSSGAAVALYQWNCSSPNGAPDMTLGPADWKPTHGEPCVRLGAAGAAEAGAELFVLSSRVGPAAASLVELQMWYKPGDHYVVGSPAGQTDALASGYTQIGSLGYVWPAPGTPNATSRYGLPSISKDNRNYMLQDYWRGRIWTPMLQLVAWGLEEYESEEVKGALAGLAQQSKALLLRDWLGFASRDGYSGTGRRVYENYGADTAEGYSYSSSAFPMYAWGALAGFVGLRTEGFYGPLNGSEWRR